MTHALHSYSAPASDALLVDPATVPEDRRRFLPRYGDTVWSFLALTQNPSAPDDQIHWDDFPPGYRETLRHAAWALVNFPLSNTDLVRHAGAMRAKLGAAIMQQTIRNWRVFALWLERRDITTLAAATVEDLADYSRYLAKESGLESYTVQSHLTGLTRLHIYTRTYLAPADVLIEPPWIEEGVSEYLPGGAVSVGENITEPITPETLGPLLIWALRMVEDFADDIIDAFTERKRLTAVAEACRKQGAGIDNLLPLVTRLKAAGKPIPTRLKYGKTAAAGLFLAGITSTSPYAVNYLFNQTEWRDYLHANPGPAVLSTPIRGTIDGQPWHSGIQFDEATTLMKQMVGACFIVIAYLTGMRPGEILALEHGCCPDPDGPPDAARRHVIRGRHFKTARDEHGNHQSAGVIRNTPWIAVPQVVRAIRVLERIVGPGKLLFDAVTTDRRRSFRREGRSLSSSTIRQRVQSAIDLFNDLAKQHGRDAEVIPPDPHGWIGIRRFRRTLAWHIARKPGGLVALALQYGHMRTIVSEGYYSRARGGIHELVDFETARVVAEHLSDVHEALQNGEGVSGPAARRLINSAIREHEQFEGMILTNRQAKNLLSDPTLNVYNNPGAFLTCNYDPSKNPLCHRGRDGSDRGMPNPSRCQSSCANIARTDTHVEDLIREAGRLLTEADSPLTPMPLADRLRLQSAELHSLAERHRRERLTIEEVAP